MFDSIFGFDASGKQQSIHRLVTDADWDYVETQQDRNRSKSLTNPAVNPLDDYHVIYTTLTAWPIDVYPLLARASPILHQGGGFMTQNVTSAGFLTGATPSPLVTGTLARSSSSAEVASP